MTADPHPPLVPGLPQGTLARLLEPADAEEVAAVTAEVERETVGTALVETADVVADWSRPSFDLRADAVGVVDDSLQGETVGGGGLLAYAEVYRGERAEVHVRPRACDRGIGTALLAWTEQVARRHGSARVGQTVPVTNERALALLRGSGRTRRYTSWVLRLPEGQPLGPAAPPAGYTLRRVRAGEGRAAHGVVEEAFGEWPGRSPSSYEDWAARVVDRAGFDPGQLVLAVTGAGTVVGVAALAMAQDGTGWVDQLAVARAHRGRGLGAALLHEGFAELRGRGATSCELSTDSRTGALGLYQHVGMQVVLTFEHWALDL